jgi:hypothetical protein
MSHAHIHLFTSLMITTRRLLGSFQQNNIISDTGGALDRKSFHVFFSVFKVLFWAKLIKLVVLKMRVQHLVVQL